MREHSPHKGGMERARAALAALLFSGAAAIFATVAAHAFQSTQIETVTAECMTGGVVPSFLKISHRALSRASSITREVVILGEAGFDTPPVPPPYNQRMTIFSPPHPDNQIEVLLEYRFVPPQGTPGDVVQSPSIIGPDPTAFAFEISPSSVTTGSIEYRLLARRLTGGTTTFEALPREVGGEVRWFTTGVQANALQVMGMQGGRFTLLDGNPADGETYLDVPRGLFGGPTAVTLDEIPLNDPAIPPGLPEAIRVYHLSSEVPLRGNVLLSLLYPDFEYPEGQDGIIDGSQIPEGTLGIAWFDGFIWRRLGGLVNPALNTVTAKVGHFSYFAVVPFGALGPADQRPMEKIITPNGDGINDVAIFTFSNPLDNIKVEIFDMTGHRIRTLFSSTDNGWDGKDDGGSTVESGVFIYQYKSGGTLVSGLIAVAK